MQSYFFSIFFEKGVAFSKKWVTIYLALERDEC